MHLLTLECFFYEKNVLHLNIKNCVLIYNLVFNP